MAENVTDFPTSGLAFRQSVLLLICLALSVGCSPASPDIVASQVDVTAPIVVREAALREQPGANEPAQTAAPIPAAAIARPSAPSGDFVVNTTLAPDRPLEPGDYLWDDEGVPDGSLSIVVDIAAQKMYVYRAGFEIGRAFVVYGHDDKPTPEGVFPILEKRKDHISNLYGAPMPYMMRLTWDGVAIHAAEVDDRYATHGCVGVPDEFAAMLFAAAKVGDKVMVTNDWKPEVYKVQTV